MSKRGNKGGTVYEDARGRWWAQLPADDEGRRPRRRAATKEAAEELLREMHQERKNGRNLSKRAGSVAHLLDQYLEAIAGDVEPSTLRNYRGQARHIAERLGDRPFDGITFLEVKKLAGQLRAAGLGFEYSRDVLRRMHSAFALVQEQMPGGRNPVDFARLKLRKPKGEGGDTEGEGFCSPAELRAILEAGDDREARGGDYRFGIAWWMGALLALRRSEFAARRWQDVDWKAGTLHVRTHWAIGADGRSTLRPGTKNGLSFVQPIGPQMLARLREQWELHQQDRRRQGWKEQGFIICYEDGSPVSSVSSFHARLRTLCRQAGLPPCNPHKLRHSAATIIGEAGFSEAVIAKVLNHITKPTVTRRYTHATPEAVRAAIGAVEAAVLGAAQQGQRGAR